MADDSLKLSVSPIVMKDGERMAYVTFEDPGRNAEGVIPACKIQSSKGFSAEEVQQLEGYMRDNLAKLKQMAASVNPMDAFLGKRK